MKLAVAVCVLLAPMSLAHAADWTTAPLVHVILRSDAPGPAHEFTEVVARAGGHVAILVPPHSAIVYADAATLASSDVAPWIARADERAIDPATLGAPQEDVARSARVWNEFLAMRAEPRTEAAHDHDLVGNRIPDAGPVPVALPEQPVQRDLPTYIPYGSQYYDTSSYLAGSTAVGVWLLEAAGSTYDWSQAEEDQTLAGVQSGLTRWVGHGGAMANLTFTLDIHTDVPVSGVPIEHPQNWDTIWIGEVLTNAGWPGADAFQRCFAYNTSIRNAFQTNWCFSYFIVDSDPAVNQGLFQNGGYAWSYYGGPFVWMSRYSTWAFNAANYFEAVPEHEMGHTFWATDEYDGLQQFQGYLNWNDSASTSVICIMNQNVEFRVCQPTQRQLAWHDVDGNGVMAPLDVPATADVFELLPDPIADFTPTWTGRAQVQTLNNVNSNDRYNPPNDITIVKIDAVECRVDGGAWSAATPADGAFDAYGENFSWTAPPLANGVHVAEARAHTTAGIWTTVFDSDAVTVTGSPVAAPELASAAPMLSASPNPARAAVELAWRIPDAPATLSVYDAAGRTVLERAVTETQGRLAWDGRDRAGKPVAAGVYLVRLGAGAWEQTRRVVLLR